MSSLQERFWIGEFGDNYTDRNRGGVASNICLFSQIIRRTQSIRTICELGANIGLNLRALHALLPQAEMAAVEINHKAAEDLE